MCRDNLTISNTRQHVRNASVQRFQDRNPLFFWCRCPYQKSLGNTSRLTSSTQLPASSEYNAILVIVDRLTKMAILVPTISNINAPLFTQLFINHVYSKHGVPNTLVTDRGTQSTSRFWNTIAGLLGLESRFSTAYHPQTDGQTEIVNQWLDQYLCLYMNYKQLDWASLLPIAELCYNSSEHSSSGISPIQALTGVDPKTTFSEPSNQEQTGAIHAIDLH